MIRYSCVFFLFSLQRIIHASRIQCDKYFFFFNDDINIAQDQRAITTAQADCHLRCPRICLHTCSECFAAITNFESAVRLSDASSLRDNVCFFPSECETSLTSTHNLSMQSVQIFEWCNATGIPVNFKIRTLSIALWADYRNCSQDMTNENLSLCRKWTLFKR